jgi:hypothetical protein
MAGNANDSFFVELDMSACPDDDKMRKEWERVGFAPIPIARRKKDEETSRSYIPIFKPGKKERIYRYMYEHWCGPMDYDPNDQEHIEQLKDTIRRNNKVYFKWVEDWDDKRQCDRKVKKPLALHEFVPFLKIVSPAEVNDEFAASQKPKAERIDPKNLTAAFLKEECTKILLENGVTQEEIRGFIHSMSKADLCHIYNTGEIPVGSATKESDEG